MRIRAAHVSDLHTQLVDALAQVILCLLVPLVGNAVVQLPLNLVLPLQVLILLGPLSFQFLKSQPHSMRLRRVQALFPVENQQT